MKTICRLLVAMMLSFTAFLASAQNDGMALTLLPHSVYNNYYNPGIRVESRAMLGIGFSNVGFSIYNSSIKYKNIYNFENGEVVSLDINKLINSLDEYDNYFGTSFSMDFLNFGFKIMDKMYLDLNWRLKFNGELNYARDLVGFFINGNGNYMGTDNPANFSMGLGLDILSEISVGLQYNISDKLTVGVRPKFVAGVYNLNLDNKNTQIYTDPNTFEIIGDVNINTRISSIFDENISSISESALFQGELSIGELMKMKDNFGFGIDFGASYIFNQHFGLAAGVYDLGFVKWNNTKEKQVTKQDMVISEPLAGNLNDLVNMELNISDMYKNLFTDVWESDSLHSADDYKTSLHTKIMLQAYYELNPFARFTAIGQMCYVNNKYRPALTMAYSGSFFKFLNVTANYTVSKYSGNYLGAGLGFDVAFMSIYVVTDNILILSNIGASASKFITSYETANVRFGIMFKL